jgi:hypothetical protein
MRRRGGRLVAVASLLGLTVAAPIAAQPVPDDCLEPAGKGPAADKTLTNRLVTPDTIPNPVHLGRTGDPERYTVDLETRLQEDVPSARNFEVVATLTASDGKTMEDDAFVVTAAARNERQIEVSICLDPAPLSGTLDAGVYQAEVEFVDPRIPEAALLFDVWVGGAAGAGFAVVVLVVGVLLLAVLPAAIALAASLAERDWRAELRGTLPWLVPLLLFGAVGYVWAAVAFPATDRYHLWSPSLDGAQEFLGFAFGKLTIAVTAVIALLAAVPKWRETWGKLLAPEPTATERPTPTTTRPPAAEPAPEAAPERRRSSLARWLVIAALLVVGWLVVQSRSSPEDQGDDFDFGIGTTTVQQTTTTAVGTTSTRPGGPSDILERFTVGVTLGEEAVAGLRDVGFVVFDYFVCSNSISEPGLLRQVRDTVSGDVVVDSRGPTALAGDVTPPRALDVLITSGEPCSG